MGTVSAVLVGRALYPRAEALDAYPILVTRTRGGTTPGGRPTVNTCRACGALAIDDGWRRSPNNTLSLQ